MTTTTAPETVEFMNETFELFTVSDAHEPLTTTIEVSVGGYPVEFTRFDLGETHTAAAEAAPRRVLYEVTNLYDGPWRVKADIVIWAKEDVFGIAGNATVDADCLRGLALGGELVVSITTRHGWLVDEVAAIVGNTVAA